MKSCANPTIVYGFISELGKPQKRVSPDISWVNIPSVIPSPSGYTEEPEDVNRKPFSPEKSPLFGLTILGLTVILNLIFIYGYTVSSANGFSIALQPLIWVIFFVQVILALAAISVNAGRIWGIVTLFVAFIANPNVLYLLTAITSYGIEHSSSHW